MKILVISRFVNMPNWQIGNFEMDNICTLIEAGHDVRVLGFDNSSFKTVGFVGCKVEIVDGIKCARTYFPYKRFPCFFHEKLIHRVMLYGFKKIIDSNWKPDIIHAHFGDIAWLATDIKKKNQEIPFVITEHYSLMNKKNPSTEVYKKAIKAYSLADKRLCVSNSFKNELESNTGLKFEIVPNVLDPKVFNDDFIPRNTCKTHSPYRIISAGNFYRIKQFDLLIKVFSKLKADCILDIYGDGEEFNTIHDLIKEYGLNSRIKLKGRISRADLVEEMKKSDLFVLLSKKETFGVSFIEAIASGVPVISLNCGGTSEFINEFNGKIIESNDVNEIASQIDDFIIHFIGYNPLTMSKEIMKKYCSKKVGKCLEDIYKEVL